MNTDNERLAQQIRFLLEIDKLKQILRQTWLVDGSRRENDAEHSWHLALMVMLLQEYAKEPELDLLRTLKMVLVHDLVEIDAGDTYLYDTAATANKVQREQRAADRIFALLPVDQAAEIRALWEEFEARETPEARYAAAVDRFQPLLHNYITEGIAWKQHGITPEMVVARCCHMADGSPALWEYAQALIRDAAAKGFLRNE